MPARAQLPALSENGFDLSSVLVTDFDTLGPQPPHKRRKLDFGGEQEHETANLKETGYNEESEDAEDDETFIAAQQAASHRRNATAKQGLNKRGGSFQSMGFDTKLLKAITRKGFSIPTPIQRRTIPLILDGRDVVGMARTGSGKTACFLLPMIEKLKSHSVKVGSRAIVLSPSRELAIQTLKFIKEFGRGSDLRTVLLVGGDSLEDQFGQMTNNPDIIIATPGRFMHLLVEMSLDLSSIRYVVFDEADRLFEAGFAPQLNSLLTSLPAGRQTLLFSATLPKSVAEFAKAGLKDPELVRLDAESKISPDLQSAFLTVKNEDKEGALLHLLTDIIKVSSGIKSSQSRDNDKKVRKQETDPQKSLDHPNACSTIIFTATKHHVEYLAHLLEGACFDVSYVYGSLDQTARNSQINSFRRGESNILVVTDVAARGIDIPMLANVINYDFPSQPKIYIHRVGRTARAGRKGWSYGLVQTSEVPYLIDLKLFLGRRLVNGRSSTVRADFSEDLVVGTIPQTLLERHCEWVVKILQQDGDLAALRGVALKGEKQYLRSRTSASTESVKQAKSMMRSDEFNQAHVLYGDLLAVDMPGRDTLLARINSFRPPETIFEYKRGNTSNITEIMKKQRWSRILAKRKTEREISNLVDEDQGSRSKAPSQEEVELDEEDPALNYSSSSNQAVLPAGVETSHLIEQDENWHDLEHFMSFQPRTGSLAEERGYGVQLGSSDVMRNNSFASAAHGVTMDLADDELKGFGGANRPKQRWDKRGKKYVNVVNDEDGSRRKRMIFSETGHKIPATFRSGRFDTWKRANRVDRMPRNGEKESSMRAINQRNSGSRFIHSAKKAPKVPDKYRDDYYKKKKKIADTKAKDADGPISTGTKRPRSELRTATDVRKHRALKQRKREKNARPSRKTKR